MGAKNVLAAYQRWAGRVPSTSMQILAYMAAVSKDSDDWPWFGLGQAALADLAMGRSHPDRSDVRAVQRAMQPLLDAGAVTVDRAGASRSDGNTTARYRLNLDALADSARARWAETYDGKRRTSDARRDPQHTTKSGGDIRRKVTQHTTVFDATYDGNRRPKDEEKIKRSEKTKEEDLDLSAHVTPAHPSGSEQPAPVISIETRRPLTRAQQNIAEASARVTARKAAKRQPDDTTEAS